MRIPTKDASTSWILGWLSTGARYDSQVAPLVAALRDSDARVRLSAAIGDKRHLRDMGESHM